MKVDGPRITVWVSGLILLALAVFLMTAGLSAASIKTGIDATGRSSLLLFSIAFTASSLRSLWKTPLTFWTLRNRRWIGLSFAASHFIHLALILAISLCFPEPFLSDQSKAQWVFGGLGYLFVALMALTSTDQAQTWMGQQNWKRLHFIGSHWLWAVFALTYVEHTKKGPVWFYAPLLVFTLALIPVRMAKHNPPGALHGTTN